MNEQEALANLDRRMRDAATDLHQAVEKAVGQAGTSGVAKSHGENGSLRLADDAPLETSADPHTKRRWQWAAAAAAVLAIAGIGVAVVLVDDDDGSPPTNPTRATYLVPGWLPDGWAPLEAQMIAPTAEQPPTVTVYGDADAARWWEGERHITVMSTGATDLTTSLEAERIDVAGHQATIETDGDSEVVTVQVSGDEQLVVSGSNVDRRLVLAVAAAAVGDTPIEAALPAGMAEAASGAVDTFGGRYAARTFAASYGTDPGEPVVGLAQRPGDAAEVGLIGIYLVDTPPVETTVRGQPGVILTMNGSTNEAGDETTVTIVQWAEPTGVLVTVYAEGTADDELDRILDDLRPAGDSEIDTLLEEHPDMPDGTGPASPDDGGELSENVTGVVVAEGERDGKSWRVTADVGSGDVEVAYEDEHGGFAFSTGAAPDGPRQLDVSTASWENGAGLVPTIGLAGSTITDVVVEAPGQPQLALELYHPEGLSRPVFVGFVPRPYVDGEVVGRDRNGDEVARASLADELEFIDDDGDGDDGIAGTVPRGDD